MSLHRLSSAASLMLVFACHGAWAFIPQPAYDFGTISAYATARQPAPSYGANGDYSGIYSKQLTFNLSSDEAIRIDVRAAQQQHSKYNDATRYFGTASFNVFDSTHTLIGTSVADPTYSARSCEYYGTSSRCSIELGLTFASTLKAGAYSFEFNGTITGHSFPEVYFGVALDQPNLIPAYLKDVTSPTPEPATAIMMALGLTGLLLTRRQKSAA